MAKVIRPILRRVFPRERLFKWFDGMRERPAIWVSGPPGCGKTTLVNSYLEARKIHCLWYQVEEGDTDVATFFYYLGQAERKAGGKKREPLPLLTSEYLPGLPTVTVRYFGSLYTRLKPCLATWLRKFFLCPGYKGVHRINPQKPRVHSTRKVF